ncbi:MAG: hypothetical protein K0B37_13385 [Bacteroidales bacterium]|nr:hypothetical protein [Bacteroidales bacterium]
MPIHTSLDTALFLAGRTTGKPGLKPMTFKPEVYVVHPAEAIVWCGSFLKVMYRGDHTFS